MKLIDEEFKKTLYVQAKNQGFSLENEQLEQFLIYKKLLQEYNTKINLTTIIDDEEIIIKHFIDCLMITKQIKENSCVLDVGTGAGFPGIVISIYFKDNIDITLLEAVGKKIKFLEFVKQNLNIKNLKILCGRAEEFSRLENYREQFDIVVARAVSSLNILIELTVPFLKINGQALLMKGKDVKEELLASQKALGCLNCIQKEKNKYEIMIDKDKTVRYIVVIEKLKTTDKEYPREYKKIKKQPL